MNDFRKLDKLVTRRYPSAVAVEYSCTDDPNDVCLWTVRDGNGQLLYNSNVATENSWPGLWKAVDVLAVVARALPGRGDGLIYRVGSGGAR